MAIQLEDLEDIIQHLDDRYVMKTDCNDNQKKINESLSGVKTKIDLFEQKWNILEKLIWAIATATIGTLVTTTLSLIMR